MTYSENLTTVSSLLQQNASQVQAWLDAVVKGQQKAPENFNWLGLAESAAAKARSGEYSTPLEWARIANAIYDYLINKAGTSGQQSLMVSQMMFRVFLIKKYGAVPNDPLLDVNQVVEWFSRQLEMPYEQVAKLTASWKELPTNEILVLRRIKNRISVIRGLYEGGQLKPSPEIAAWVALRDKLP